MGILQDMKRDSRGLAWAAEQLSIAVMEDQANATRSAQGHTARNVMSSLKAKLTDDPELRMALKYLSGCSQAGRQRMRHVVSYMSASQSRAMQAEMPGREIPGRPETKCPARYLVDPRTKSDRPEVRWKIAEVAEKVWLQPIGPALFGSLWTESTRNMPSSIPWAEQPGLAFTRSTGFLSPMGRCFGWTLSLSRRPLERRLPEL